MIQLVLALLLVLGVLTPAYSTDRYIATNGNDATATGTTTFPYKTFAAIFAVTQCGDRVLVRNGRYGDGQSASGKPSPINKVCPFNLPITFKAENERQAGIYDNGTGYAFRLRSSAYWVIEGLVFKSVDNSSSTLGELFGIESSSNITVRYNLFSNPNRYGNNHASYVNGGSHDVLFEDNEAYIVHRHCVASGGGTYNITVRRQYCNARGGKIPGGFGAGGQPTGSGDAIFSMYPCRDCILENSIADGTTHPMYLNEQNANFDGGIVVSGNKVLGNICYRCNAGNGVITAARNNLGLNYAPQNITISNNVFIDFGAISYGIRLSDCVGCLVSRNSVFAINAGSNRGVSTDNALKNGAEIGSTPAQNSATIRDNLVDNAAGIGFSVTGFNTYTGNNNRSFSNGTSFSPSLPGNWGTTYTNDPAHGGCKIYVKSTATGHGQGTEGGDIGANVLYETVGGVTGVTPLWNASTGAWVRARAFDLDGINAVAGQSLFDFHDRIHVQDGTCSLPAGYGDETPPVSEGPYYPAHGTASPLLVPTVIPTGTDFVFVQTAAFDVATDVGTFTSVTGCANEAYALVPNTAFVTSPTWRRGALYYKQNPTSGTCNITVTTSGAVTRLSAVSYVLDGVLSLNTGVSSSGADNSPTVTALTASAETVMSFLVSTATGTVTPCANQVFEDFAHPEGSLRISGFTKSGANNGTSCATLSLSPFWGMTSVSLQHIPSSGAPTVPTGLRVRRQ